MEQIKILDAIQGSSFLSIQSAVKVLRAYGVKVLPEQKIEVVNERDSIVVLFINKEKRYGVRQGAGALMNDSELQRLDANEPQVKVTDTIEGRNFLATSAAMQIFQQHNPDLNHYKITVVHDGKSIVVMFTNKDKTRGGRGNTGTRPEFEVELEPETFKVIRSNFIR